MYIVYALSIITYLLRDHGIMPQFAPNSQYVDGERKPVSEEYARNFFDIIKVIERKAATQIFDYEFFKLLKVAILSHADGDKPDLEEIPPGAEHLTPKITRETAPFIFNESHDEVRQEMVREMREK